MSRGLRWSTWLTLVLALWLPCAGQVLAQCVNIVSPATLPGGTVGVAYAQTLTDSGPAPSTYAVTAGALPAGLALAAGGVLSGTPTTPASYNFTVTATDGSGCPGSQAYTVAVLAPVITVSPAALPDGTTNVAYVQTVSASGGTGPYSFAVTAGSLPAGVVLSAGGTLSGTPTVAAAYNYTITATDAFGSTGARAYKMAIIAPTIVLSPATLPTGQAGTAYAQALSATGGAAPYTFAVSSGSLPAGLLLAPNGTLSGTPTGPGAQAFTVTATDSNGNSGSLAYTLTIANGNVPVAVSRTLTTQMGIPVQVDLTAGASGGPFTAATLVAVGAGGSATIDANQILTFTPAPGFLGNVQVDYTLGNTWGPSPVASLTFAVVARPDPTRDPDVVGLASGQDASVRIFAETQTRHVDDRLDTLHDLGPDLWGWWISGTHRGGDRNDDADGPAQAFQVDGVTVGGDYRAGTRFTFGGALGYDRSHDRIGVRGSRLGARASSVIGYGSFHPDLPFFLDGTVGHQRIAVHTLRALPVGDSLAGGDRSGQQTFSSWSSGYRWKHRTWQLSAYGRMDVAQARLDGYAEDGDPTQALRYDAESIATRTRTLGLRGKFQHKTGWGIVEPRARVELLHDFHDRDGTWVQYVDQPDGPRYFLAPQGDGGNREVVELGVVFKTRLLTINVQYLGMYGGLYDNDRAWSLTFQNAR